ncbi:MAG: hypothetical protein R3B54_10065 [Bdellovibrionota bacterium]
MNRNKNIDYLHRLTGLTPNELAEVLQNNPRAYMSVKGAVAEKHLDKTLSALKADQTISDYRKGRGDFEKDFYVRLTGKKEEVSIECKNVRVLDLGSLSLKREYLKFLKRNQYDLDLPDETHIESLNNSELRDLYKSLPQEYSDSGVPRFSFSRNLAKVAGPIGKNDPKKYLQQFGDHRILIDFKRTRNSRDVGETDNRAKRLYKIGEIDIVAACLFSRTLEWDFVYCGARCFVKHHDYNDRFSDAMHVAPDTWTNDLRTVLRDHKID